MEQRSQVLNHSELFSVEYSAFAHSEGEIKNRHVEFPELLWILTRSLGETGKKQVLYFCFAGYFIVKVLGKG